VQNSSHSTQSPTLPTVTELTWPAGAAAQDGTFLEASSPGFLAVPVPQGYLLPVGVSPELSGREHGAGRREGLFSQDGLSTSQGQLLLGTEVEGSTGRSPKDRCC